MIPPSARRTVSSTVSSVTSFTKASVSFSGKALWIISTSAFLIGVPWALAYAEEEQYIQMEREQGMIKGANEVCLNSRNHCVSQRRKRFTGARNQLSKILTTFLLNRCSHPVPSPRSRRPNPLCKLIPQPETRRNGNEPSDSIGNIPT